MSHMSPELVADGLDPDARLRHVKEVAVVAVFCQTRIWGHMMARANYAPHGQETVIRGTEVVGGSDLQARMYGDKAKPADILEKIISGKINKIVSEVTLLGQPYVLDTNVSVAEALKKEGADVVSVARLAVGEGIEKVEEDFAAEVMKQAGLR